MRAARIIFRVDASADIGTGHVIRCLTLAERLKQQGAAVAFVCRELAGNLCDFIEGRGFELHRLPNETTAWVADKDDPPHARWVGLSWQEDARQFQEVTKTLPRPDWIVVDHYGLDGRWEERIRATGTNILVIDDLADRSHDCDLLLDQNLVAGMSDRYVGRASAKCSLLLGPTYALLQQSYARLRPRTPPREGMVRRLLISFGGFDSAGLTEKTVRALLSLGATELEADIVLSSASPQFQTVADLVDGNPWLLLHDRVPSLAPLILAADLAIGASGTTNWERLCLGLPALVVTVADNQRPSAEELAKQKLIRWLGDASAVDESTIAGALAEALIEDMDGTWSDRAMAFVDGEGASRVGAVLLAHPGMELRMRHAELRDEVLLLDWANDPLTRRNAFNPKPIAAGEHRAWFRTRLRGPGHCVLFIAETPTDIPVGQVRFDRRDKAWEISYAVAPPFRGRGVGQTMLAVAIQKLREEHANVTLFGQVKTDNLASCRIFETLGFVAQQASPGRLVFELSYGK